MPVMFSYCLIEGRRTGGLFVCGAATQIRTGDLVLTKDALYQLSHSSIDYVIIATLFRFVNNYFKKY